VSEPTKYFQQHHAVEAPAIGEHSFRPFWRVRTRLDQLLIDGAISFPVWRAAALFRTLSEIVIADDWPATSMTFSEGGALGFDVSSIRRIDALNRLHAIRNCVGRTVFAMIERHVVEDQSWTQLAGYYGVHPKTVRSWTIAALQALAAIIWGEMS